MYDVIVVGARCAGAPTAMLLARNGYRVALLDQDIFPSDMRMSTHFIHPRGIAYLQRWGLLQTLQATDCLPVTRYTIDLGPVRLSGAPPAVDGIGTAYGPRRLILDEILVRGAEKAGAELRDGCEVESVLTENGRVCGVRGKTSTGVAFSEYARIVIGADGPTSCVARSVQAPEYNQKPALQGTAWSYWSGVVLEDFQVYLRDYEGIYAFQTSSDRALIGTNWSMHRFRAARENIERSYFAVLEGAAPDLAEQMRNGKREEGFHLGATRNFFRKPYGNGWALVGDASYKKDPCTAQGITDAFYDATLLVDALTDGLSGRCTLAQALARYERQRDTWTLPYYEFTCELATFAPPPPEAMRIYETLQDDPDGTTQLLGVITQTVSPTEFFAPENVRRLLADRRRLAAQS